MAVRSVKQHNLPKFYKDANSSKPREYWDYEKLNIEWGEMDDYEVVQKIGRGKYSEVFTGFHIPTNKKCVIKVLKPVKKKKIKRELKILQNVQGGVNIVELRDVVRDPLTKTPCLVFEHINNVDWKTLYPSFKLDDIRFYMYQVFKALDHCHSMGLVHRDIKPHNIMIDPVKRELRLIDWGLAEFYHPMQEYNVRVATRHYKGPELLVDDTLYDYSLDSWSIGCVIAGMIFKKEPFFQGADNIDQLAKIAKILGTDMLHEYLDTYSLDPEPEVTEHLGNLPRKEWISLKTKDNADRICPEVLDLIDKLLRYDPAARILPKEALLHPFFKPVREEEAKGKK